MTEPNFLVESSLHEGQTWFSSMKCESLSSLDSVIKLLISCAWTSISNQSLFYIVDLTETHRKPEKRIKKNKTNPLLLFS